MKQLIAITLALGVAQLGATRPKLDTLPMKMWRLDCGEAVVRNLEGKGARTFSNGCYLIRHGRSYVLWDTGAPAELVSKPDDSPEQTVTMKRTIVDQLGDLRLSASDISVVGISHYHGDHVGQAAQFPKARLIVGKADMAVFRSNAARSPAVAPWLGKSSRVTEISGNFDLFGDSKLVFFSTPGHTPGHHSLLVRLKSGAVILTGDAAHFRDQLTSLNVPGNGTNLPQAKESLRRLLALGHKYRAKIIVQHEPADIAKLPAFPKAAE